MSWGFAAQHLRDETSENIVMKTLMMKRRLQLADVCCHYSLCWAEIIQTFALKWNMNSSGGSRLLDFRLKQKNCSSSQIKKGLDPKHGWCWTHQSPSISLPPCWAASEGGESISSSLFLTVFHCQSRLMFVLCFIIHAHWSSDGFSSGTRLWSQHQDRFTPKCSEKAPPGHSADWPSLPNTLTRGNPLPGVLIGTKPYWSSETPARIRRLIIFISPGFFPQHKSQQTPCLHAPALRLATDMFHEYLIKPLLAAPAHWPGLSLCSHLRGAQLPWCIGSAVIWIPLISSSITPLITSRSSTLHSSADGPERSYVSIPPPPFLHVLWFSLIKAQRHKMTTAGLEST